jgi:hypothetical protein
MTDYNASLTEQRESKSPSIFADGGRGDLEPTGGPGAPTGAAGLASYLRKLF